MRGQMRGEEGARSGKQLIWAGHCDRWGEGSPVKVVKFARGGEREDRR